MEKYTKDKLQQLVNESKSFTEVLIKYGRRASGGNFVIIKKYVSLFNISTSHFDNFKQERLKILNGKKSIKLDDCLVVDSKVSRGIVKKKLYDSGLKSRICEMCGQDEFWRGKKMSLILDHINGVHNDNRIENLRIVCPNCNATLDTHCGKNNKKFVVLVRDENNQTEKQRIAFQKRLRFNIPKSELEKIVFEKPIIQIAKEYGFSDVLIHKYCKKWGIKKPKIGYWHKKNKLS
jgi:hypothetical protein